MLDALSKGKIGGKSNKGYGHDSRYWSSMSGSTKLRRDFVAHSGQAYFVGDEFLNVFSNSSRIVINEMERIFSND